MQRLFPITVGILTIALFGGLGTLFLSEGRTYWAAFFIGLTVLRVLAWFYQLSRLIRANREED